MSVGPVSYENRDVYAFIVHEYAELEARISVRTDQVKSTSTDGMKSHKRYS